MKAPRPMPASFATSLLFAFSIVFAARSTRRLGSTVANLARMTVALIFLGVWAHGWGEGAGGASLPFFLLSGVIGFGFGDLALYQALPRIGPRLTILLNQCLAAPVAALAERLWLGVALTPAQLLWSGVILGGVALALAPAHALEVPPRLRWSGTFFGLIAAAGQGLGAVVSRKAYQVAALSGSHVDGGTAAYQRMLGGIVVAGGFFLLTRLWFRWRPRPEEEFPEGDAPLWRERWRAGWPWMFLNAMAGPVMGIACYQHALATTASGIVLPIVATSPVFAMALAFLLEGERPSLRSMAGGILAVAGSIALVCY